MCVCALVLILLQAFVSLMWNRSTFGGIWKFSALRCFWFVFDVSHIYIRIYLLFVLSIYVFVFPIRPVTALMWWNDGQSAVFYKSHDAGAANDDDGIDDDDDGDGDAGGDGDGDVGADFTANHLFSLLTSIAPTMPTSTRVPPAPSLASSLLSPPSPPSPF